MHLYDGAQEPFWDLKILQNVKHVDFLIHALRMTDVPHVNNEILRTQTEDVSYSIHTSALYLTFFQIYLIIF